MQKPVKRTNRPFRQILMPIRVFVDLTMITLAWGLAYYLRFYTALATPLGIPPATLYFKLVPFIIVIWLTVFYFLGFYKRTGAHYSPFIEALDIIQCSLIAIFAFIAFTYYYEEYRYSRLTVLIFGSIHPLLLIAGRSFIRKSVRRYTRSLPKRQTLIVGSDSNLWHTVALCTENSLEPMTISGVILIGDPEMVEDDRRRCKERGLHIFETPEDWAVFFVENPTSAVYIALPHRASDYLETHLDAIAGQVPDVKLIPDILKYTRFSPGVELYHGVPVISIHESPLIGSGRMVKRALDVVGSLCALIVFAPLMLLIATLIPLGSRGPILYRQERMGMDGRPFYCLKFRSMPIDAEAKTGAVWAKPQDGRATWFGSLLRRTSLDELPQLFNVFKGDMSLVGPRPERPVFVNEFRQNIPNYMLRHKVKAGITGWAQVNGWRGNTSLDKRIEFDLYYIQNWSIWLDMRIISMTFWEVLFSKNAY